MRIPASNQWRSLADVANPAAGPLYTSGKNAPADIVCETGTISGRCGSVCTGSATNWCC
jgi:hypothetical protein